MKYYITEAGKELLSEWDPKHAQRRMRSDSPGAQHRLGKPYRTTGVERTMANVEKESQARAKRPIPANPKDPRGAAAARDATGRTTHQRAQAAKGTAREVRRAMARVGRPTDKSHLTSVDDLRGAPEHGGPIERGGAGRRWSRLAGPKRTLPK